MRTTAVFLAVVASGAGKEPRKATVCVRGSVPGTSVERAEEHVTLVQGRTVAENALELKLAEGRDVGEGGRHGEREEEERRAIGAITAAGAPLSVCYRRSSKGDAGCLAVKGFARWCCLLTAFPASEDMYARVSSGQGTQRCAPAASSVRLLLSANVLSLSPDTARPTHHTHRSNLVGLRA